MFSILSKNGVALVVFAFSAIGIEVAESDVVATMSAIGQVVSFALMVWNQFDRKDITGFLWRK
jgi:hypothetical protein